MAKGFTVKAAKPAVKKKPEWDYERARELVKGKSNSSRLVCHRRW